MSEWAFDHILDWHIKLGYTVTPGEWPILQTAQVTFVARRAPPMSENKTVLFYFNLFSCSSPSVMVNLQCPTTQICVSKCPEKFLTYVEMQFIYRQDKNYWTYYSQFCKSNSVKPAKEMITKVLQRCFPDFSTKNGTLTVGNKTMFEDGNGKKRNVIELRAAANGVNKILQARTIGMKVFEDYATTWYWILIGLTIAMLLSWLFVILLRFTAAFLFWVFILGVLGIIGYGIWHCYREYGILQGKPNSHLTIYDIGIQTDISMYFQLKQTWFAFCEAIGYIPTTLIYPFLTFIFLSICISYWAVIAVYLATSGVPIYKVITPEGQCKYENNTCDPESDERKMGNEPFKESYSDVIEIAMRAKVNGVKKIFNTTEIAKTCPGAQCIFASYGGKSLYHQYITTFQIFNMFVFLWLINFIIALGQCALAGAFASYYWALKKPDDIPPYPLFTSFGRAIRYHTGSLAFGSLILALIQMYRLILEYLNKHLKDAQNRISKFLQCCLKCCFWCLENVVKFFNRNAYVMIAIYGKNFCRSARDAFNLMMRNILKVAVMDRVTDFVLILGKILVSGCIVNDIFIIVFTRLQTVIIGAYLVAHGFFSVYAMCIDTIFICFCEDLERNDGSTEKPYFIAPTLHGILNKKQLVSPKQKK
ncbi:hypothetical protein MC885_012854 [Smutsia gigantea]|nr:hypothetical protein MC885_012854 [Smutsia gigantea]